MKIDVNHPQNFERLVLGCMDSYDSESRRIFFRLFEIYKIYVLLHRSDSKISFFFNVQQFCEF